MHYYFNQPINTNTVNELVEKLTDEEQINLWFSTTGGDIDSMFFLLDFLDTIKDKLVITLSSRVCSIGTLLLTDFKGKLEINPDYYFTLFHKIDCDYDSQRKTEPNSKMIISYMKRDNAALLKKYVDKGILNPEQAKKFEEGEDVVLYRDDMMKLPMFAKKNQP